MSFPYARHYMLVNILEAPILALILAYIIRYKNSATGEYVFQFNDNIPAYLLMSIIVALFLGLSVSAEEIIKDRKLFLEKYGKYRWQDYSDYKYRALVETAMFRYKAIMGDTMYSRALLAQKVESKIDFLAGLV